MEAWHEQYDASSHDGGLLQSAGLPRLGSSHISVDGRARGGRGEGRADGRQGRRDIISISMYVYIYITNAGTPITK
jgi:hypothetical protein